MVGQHIRILKAGRWVHAVDCGDETVLHLVEDAPPPRVRRAYRPEFVAGAEAVEVVTHRERTFPAKEIVKRAYSRASDPALASMFHDSESFVEWCTTGRLGAGWNAAVAVPGIVAAAGAAAAAPRNGAPGKVMAAAKASVKAKAAAPKARPAAKKKVAVKAKSAVKKPAAGKKPVKAKAAATKARVAAKKKGAVKKKPVKAKGAAKKAGGKKKGRR